MPRTKAFPKNTEIEVTLTFANEAAGGRGGSAPVRRRGRRPSQIGRGRRRTRRRGGFGGGLFSGTVASVTPTPKPSPCASTIRWSNCPTATSQPR